MQKMELHIITKSVNEYYYNGLVGTVGNTLIFG